MNISNLKKITDYIWEIPKSFRSDMCVPARIFASEKMLTEIFRDRSLEQLINVTTLQGIRKFALAMPDIHEGYGFPVGGVAATSFPDGVISPGGIGYDINCGVRLLKSQVTFDELKPYLDLMSRELHKEIPSGVGKGGALKMGVEKLDIVLNEGVLGLIKEGYGEEDISSIESQGCLQEGNPEKVSEHAKKRGKDQLGTIGAMLESFGSCCHGAGRRMSRHQAKKQMQGEKLLENLENEGIHILAGSIADLSEEAPFAYKDVSEVVDVVDKTGLAQKVAKLKPVIVIKG